MKERERARAEELLAQMTLEEKLGMIHGAQLFQTAGVPRLGIPPLVMSDGPMGVRQEFPADRWEPIGYTDDFVTYLPCGSALAATWNRALARELGGVLGEEARGRGKDVILGPSVNIKRSPLCGRNFEYFSEDPYLTGELAAPLIQGVQEHDTAACVKHFAANNQETQRLWVDAQIDERALRELYLPAFYEAVTEGGSYTLMSAYNMVNGEHCYCNKTLLGGILRGEWGYDGVVISDWGGVHDTERAAYSPLDIEMSVTDNFDEYYLAEPLKEKIQAGEIPESTVDEKVLHILVLMQRLHMLDGEMRKSGCYNTPEHRQSALAVSRESFVLLKNEKNRLPLQRKALKKVLLIGENAECIHSNGGGSAEIRALYEISPLMGLKTHLGGNVQVDYVPGYCRDERLEAIAAKENGGTAKSQEAVNWQAASLEDGGGRTAQRYAECEEARARRAAMRAEAVQRAAEYDAVIYVGGLNHELDCEGNDRPDMKLPYEQDLLIRELLQARPDAVIVLLGGSAVEMGEWIDAADTVLWGWYSGMEGGNALADVLLGDVNPSGKLPESFYRTLADCPAHSVGEFPGGKTVAYREGVYVGYRYLDTFGTEPQFCFGHGLSYTSFAYRDKEIHESEQTVSCYIKNTGECAGSETIQVYRRPKHRQDEPFQELVGFEKVYLERGEEKLVSVTVRHIDIGRYDYVIGSSSRDIRL